MARKLILAVAALSLWACTAARAQVRPSDRASSAPAEILVRFSPDSEIGRAVARAAEQGATPTEELQVAVSSVERDLGVPVHVTRLASGGVVVLGIPPGELTNVVASRLRSRVDIKHTEATPAPATSPVGSVEVEFSPGTRAAGELARANAANGDAIAKRLSQQLERDAKVALTGSLDTSGKLLVTPDLTDITQLVIDRLQKRRDVDYAQPNYSVRPIQRVP